MYIFRSIHEIISTVSTARGLLTEMFEKRKILNFRYTDALALLKDDENKLKLLIEKEVIRQNGNFLELDARFMDFFELLLEANEEINTAIIDENIEYLHELMDYYQKERIANRRARYVRDIKITFQKIARTTIRNIMNLQTSIENAFKHEPTYQIKIAKLENLDKKRINIQQLIDTTEHLILHEERQFFQQATDEELDRILLDLRRELQLSSHSLIRAQQDIINYLNQIKSQVILVAKIRRLKYLQDQFLIKTDTNIVQVLEEKNPLWMESRQYSKIRLSLEMLRENDQIVQILRKIAERNGIQKTARTEAEPLTDEDLQTHVQRLKEVDPTEVWNAFSASSYNLFDFILKYDYNSKRDIEDHAALFCQLVILHPEECRMTGKYATYQDIEYPIIYAK